MSKSIMKLVQDRQNLLSRDKESLEWWYYTKIEESNGQATKG